MLERTVQAGRTVQDNHLAYDSLGRLADVADGAVHLGFTYDAVGNRTKVVQNVRVAKPVEGSPAVVSNDELRSATRFFQYDSMNRQTVVDAIDEAGKLGSAGHLLTYDKAGNRISDTFAGQRPPRGRIVVAPIELGH